MRPCVTACQRGESTHLHDARQGAGVVPLAVLAQDVNRLSQWVSLRDVRAGRLLTARTASCVNCVNTRSLRFCYP
jgi:hypothetical protein